MHGFIAVHAGAGTLSPKFWGHYDKLCKRACQEGIVTLNESSSSLDAVTAAVKILEDSSLTNAGYGSNLTWNGTVECDASIMSGLDMRYGGCGAVSGIKNPILLARKIYDKQHEPLSLGRVPPCLLVGEGAHTWAQHNGVVTVEPASLITERARKARKHCKKKLKQYDLMMKEREKRNTEQDAIDAEQIGWEDKELVNSRMDTVGAVCVDRNGHIAAACSSGGVLLKHPGRIGQGAIIGAGCWADDIVGVVTSGCGEHILHTSLAKEVAMIIRNSPLPSAAVHDTLNKTFINAPVLKEVKEKLVGLLALQYNNEKQSGELVLAHTTKAMCVGYMSGNNNKPVIRMSSLPRAANPGNSIVLEGVCF